jgi:3-phosphoglycerate kinase
VGRAVWQEFGQYQGEDRERYFVNIAKMRMKELVEIVNDDESKLRSVEQADVRGKRIIVRVDWNVTIGKALQIVDDTRIVRTLPTIKWLLEKGAKKVVLLSHLGKAEEKRTLKPIVEYAEKLLGEEIGFGKEARVMMLENLRLNAGEDKNDPEFARELASLGDIYVNEAFGECHRSSASIVGIPKYLPSYAGLWLEQEVEAILKVREIPEHPYVVVMGGAKVEDKIKLIEELSKRADTILLGGKLANEYVQKGIKVGGKARIMVPLEGDKLLDIGAHTQALYTSEIAKAKTIVWNGPMGKTEEAQYRAGTIYTAINANEAAYTLVGGGDTLCAISQEQHLTRIDHVSTGGGAMLKLLESGSLVGIHVLQSKL